jgi:hypothetical protein
MTPYLRGKTGRGSRHWYYVTQSVNSGGDGRIADTCLGLVTVEAVATFVAWKIANIGYHPQGSRPRKTSCDGSDLDFLPVLSSWFSEYPRSQKWIRGKPNVAGREAWIQPQGKQHCR